MNWQQRNLWLILAAIVIVVAWQLTRLITHVDRTPHAPITLTIDQRPWVRGAPVITDVSALQQKLHQFAGAAMLSTRQALFVVTPATHSIVIAGIGPASASCTFVANRGAIGGILAGDTPSKSEIPIPFALRDGELTIPISGQVARFIARAKQTQSAIECRFSRALSAAPTFTERSLTVRSGRPSVPIVLDVSALEDIDDLRFSGGIQLPLGGDRVRLLYDGSNVVSAEWSEVSAQEQRDIILVLIGALSAIAAATVIEAIRPSVESKSRGRE